MLAQAIRSVFRTARTPGPTDDFWYRPAVQPTASGIAVSDSTALMLSTWWACVRVLTDTVGCLPLHVYKRTGDERKKRDKSHPWYEPLHAQPNAWQTPITFKSMLVGHLLLRGNFYARIDPPQLQVDRDMPSLVPLNPDRMEPPRQGRYDTLTYKYTYSDGQPHTFTQDEILHVKLLSLDGFTGLSPLTYARESIGLATSQTGYASSIFSGGGFLKYYLKTTKRLGAEGRKNFRDGWRDLHGDPRHFEPPILEDDMDIHTLGMNNEDAQFLESRKFSAYELCQFLGVPPHMVFLMDRATWANTEQMGIEFLTIHLNPYLVRIEQELQPILGATHFAEFLRDAIVRGDINSRYEAYSKGLQAGFLTRNEVRSRENLDPVPGGDELLTPLNMGPAGQRAPQRQSPPVREEDDEEDDEEQATVQAMPVQAEEVLPVVEAKDEPPVIPQATTINLEPLIADAAGRIVHTEVSALRKQYNRDWHTKQPTAFFQWAVKWFDKHQEYTTKIIAPLYAAAGVQSPASFAEPYCLTSMQDFASGEPSEVLTEWETNKAGRLAAQLQEILLCTTES
jgi:HK97 family phage portal protein